MWSSCGLHVESCHLLLGAAAPLISSSPHTLTKGNWPYKSGCKLRQNLTFSHNKLLYVALLVSDKFWNKKIYTPDFFKKIKKLLQYKKFLLYVRKDQSYSIKHENFAQKWEEKFRKLLGKIIILLLNEKFCISKHMALILWVFRKTPCFWKLHFLNLYAKL